MDAICVRRHVFVLCLLLTILVIACFAAKAEHTDYSYIVVRRGEYSENLITIKKKLYNNGYYDVDYDGSTLLDSTLDDLTMNALARLVSEYRDEPQYDGKGKGLTAKAEYDLLYKEDFPKKISIISEPHPIYRDIPRDDPDADDEIGSIQDRLIELGYLRKTDPSYKPRELTDSVFNALDTLLEYNHKPELKNHAIVTAEVQELIFSPQVTPKPAPGFLENLRLYFLGSTSLFGLRVPMLALWIISLLLLIACVVAVIHFFGPSDTAEAQKVGIQLKQPKGRVVKFEIAYGGKSQSCEIPLEGILEIGRNTTAIPINSQDNAVSRRHCELYFKDSDLMLRDYSSYGTNINGEVINNTQRRLNSGDTIVIGQHQIRITWK